MPPLSRLAPKLLLSFASLALVLGAAEGVLRHRNPRYIRTEWARKPVPYRQSHPVYGHGLVPGAAGFNEEKGEYRVGYRISPIGLRDREFPLQPPAGTARLLVLGDSFTEGYAVEAEQAFVKVLERRLNAAPPRPGARYETVNMGVASFSPILEYLFLKTRLPLLRGDFVLLILDPTDFSDDYHYQRGAAWGPGGEPIRVSHDGLLPNYFSHTRQFIEALPAPPLRDVYVLRYLIYHAVRLNHGRWAEARFGRIEYDRLGWTRPANPHAAAWERQLERTFGHILRIRNLARSEGMGFALATYPHAHMIHPQAWCKGRRRLYYECGKTYAAPLVSPLLRMCREKDVTCWDLAGDFRRPDIPSLFFEFDGHFTPKGNEVMAGALERRLGPLLAPMPVRP